MRVASTTFTLALLAIFPSLLLGQQPSNPASPSDIAPPRAEQPGGPSDLDYFDKGEGGKSSFGKSGCGKGGGSDCEPWTLMSHLGRDECSAWQLNGWLNGGVMLNTNNNRSSRNDPVSFSNPAGEFLMNQVWMSLDKKADNGGCGYDWGFHMDFVYGADGPDTQAFGDSGWDFGWNSGGEYGSAIPQIYVEMLYDDISIKVGHFYTILGYEVVPSVGNFFYSHSYGMNFGEPFTHTGVLVEKPWDEDTTIWGGYTFGWDSGFDNRNDAHTLIGGVSRDLNEFVTATYAYTFGRYGNGIGASGNLGDIYSHSIVLDMQLTERSNFVFVHDLGVNYGLGGAAGNAEWYGMSGYYFYEINDCWSAGARVEWFDDADGLRISTVNDGFNDLHYWSATFGLNYQRTPNFMIRPEFRMDWATSHSDMDFNDVFINNTKDHLETFAVDFILTY